eukprot:CAMPEP_0179072260 /NCGR_PEP_ID=MMETSP0796-20121207/31962_1 /TAXON_ID=73915 /ORGANISM="Pyrodinium bahamense, Strain pbaha01" /LENGTH=55 /DNA_ID=CAMNT_0020769413 /DNA_START=155 /DNA_END=322 /DNA_ORIENTATION=+
MEGQRSRVAVQAAFGCKKPAIAQPHPAPLLSPACGAAVNALAAIPGGPGAERTRT